MKTCKKLYPKIVDFDNLHQAWRKARRGKRYKPSAANFERNLDAELIRLHHELLIEYWQGAVQKSLTTISLPYRI